MSPVRRSGSAARPQPEVLRGSLFTLRRRCGTPTCRCADGEGHTSPALAYPADGQQNRNDVRATWTPPTCRRATNRLRSPRDILGPAEDTPVELEEGQSRLETAPRGMAAEVSHSFGSSSDRHSRRAAP